ncbi:hypothetical protein FNYG_07047 [Fusarium nygamai]|uniref:Uncharacterized protein n=1 Tax=Gibberella nygamai TaxID=42673 RepID=A0A2K0WBT0_GIBNY|nr:hypothetical protein FNYG_07047 [Fusarium nygamai]
MHFKFGIRDGVKPVSFMDLIVPVDQILDEVILNSVNTDDIKSLAPLRATDDIDLSELANNAKGSDLLGAKLKDVDLSSPVNLIHLVDKKVRHLRIDVDWSKLFAIDNLEFKRNFKEETFDRSWPGILANLQQLMNPYADYLIDTRFSYQHLTYKNVGEIDPNEQPDHPNKALTYFMGAEHRTAALLAGAAEEQEMIDSRALALLDIPVLAVVWPDIFSSWEPKDNDLEVHDIFFTIFHITSR